MTFEEMQLIMQQVTISQREMQTTQREMQTTQREIQTAQREMQVTLSETQLLAQSIARGVQAMQDKALGDDLKRDEEKAEHLARMAKYDEEIAELRYISRGLVNMFTSIDEDRPTILRKLNTIENKTDAIIERLNQE